MDATNALLVLSQMALAIAGFSGITLAFIRKPGRLGDVEAYRLALLFGTSFGAVFLGLLPTGLALLGVEGAVGWRIAAGTLAAGEIVFLGAGSGPTRRYLRERPELFRAPVLGSLIAGHVLNLAVQSANALGAWPARADGVYAWGIAWLLFHAAYQFSRILFIRPATGAGPAGGRP